MNKILCSTGAMVGRPNGRNYMLLDGVEEKTGCDGIEIMWYSTWYPMWEKVVDDVQKMKIHVGTFHCEKKIGEMVALGGETDFEKVEELFEINCKVASLLGAKLMVLHLWNGTISDQHIENNIKAFGWLREIAKKYNLPLTVENVVCNQKDPLTHFVELHQEYPDITFTFDTKMSEFHRQVPLIFEPEFRWLWDENCIRHIHLNDYNGGYMDWGNLTVLHPGDGRIDFRWFIDEIQSRGYEGDYTLEATSFEKDGVIHFERLQKSVDYVRKLL